MCCYSDVKAKRRFIESLNGRKTFVAWKELIAKQDVESIYVEYVWQPGVNRVTRQTKRYDLSKPSGFHVFLQKPRNSRITSGAPYVIVPVVCNVDDLWRIELGGSQHGGTKRQNSPKYCDEAVIRNKVILRLKDYKKATLAGESAHDSKQ